MEPGRVPRKYVIKDLDNHLENIKLVALLIGKQAPHSFKTPSLESRAVWNLTIRDSAIDYINVTFWGNPDKLNELYDICQIGSIVEVVKPRVIVRNADDEGEKYCPIVTSPFRLVVNEGIGDITLLRHFVNNDLLRLEHLPTKPMFNYTTLEHIYSNINVMNGSLVDLLVAVRQVGTARIVNTKNGPKHVRTIIVFDHTCPGMAISFWEYDYVMKASFWKPRETLLFITDCRVIYDSFSNCPKGSPSMKTIVTVDPRGNDAKKLSAYAQTAQLQSSPTMDLVTKIIPEASSIKTVMSVSQILLKVNQLNKQETIRLEDNQFATIIYAYVTDFDIDGVKRIFASRCSLCRSWVGDLSYCKNAVCLSNTGNETMNVEKSFDFHIQITDNSGHLDYVRLHGKYAEDILQCTPEEFLSMTEDEQTQLKWKFLMELCEIRLFINIRNKRALITLLSCVQSHTDVVS